MKCIICDRYSLSHICKKCQIRYLSPTYYNDLVGDIDVVSFYQYDDIKELLHTKYERFGSSIINILAKNSIYNFVKDFNYPYHLYSIPIDDNIIDKDYSHSAILTKWTKTNLITPVYGVMISQNRVKYANKSLEFKLANSREFNYSGPSDIDAVLVDDIVTDGVTLNEAKKTLSKYNVDVKFALVLSYAKAHR